MKFFLLNTMGDANDTNLCFIGTNIPGMGIEDWRLLKGEPMAQFFPADAKATMDDAHPGIKLASMIGNNQVFFIASSALRALVEKHCKTGVEYLPFTLLDHRKRLASKDYCLVHPIGTLDCLDEAASQIQYSKKGKAVGYGEFILDAAKIKDAPQIFRMSRFTAKIILGEALMNDIQAAGLTNVVAAPLRTSDS